MITESATDTYISISSSSVVFMKARARCGYICPIYMQEQPELKLVKSNKASH